MTPALSNRVTGLSGCDSFVVMTDSTTTGTTILGKNSDRPAYECQPLVYHAGGEHGRRDTVKLEYIEIPQAEATYATLGSGPYWSYGYEMGLNQEGVAIGNEAIYTRPLREAVRRYLRGEERPGVIGTDMVRLGLERGGSARQALSVMTDLLERHGQFGSCLPLKRHEDGSYDSSYLIADWKEAFVLETAGREWVSKRVASGFAAISNEPTIRTESHSRSKNLRAKALASGWWDGGAAPLDFAYAYVDRERPLQASHMRVKRTAQLLRSRSKISPRYCARILRDHFDGSFLEGPYFNAALPDFLTICMHSSPAGFTWGNTAASAIFILPEPARGPPTLLWTPLTPCTSCYSPFFVHAGPPPEPVSLAGGAGTAVRPATEAEADRYSPRSYWWRFSRLLDLVKGDQNGRANPRRQPNVRGRLDRLEGRFLRGLARVQARAMNAPSEDGGEAARALYAYEEKCVEDVLEAVDELSDRLTLRATKTGRLRRRPGA